MAQCTCKKKYIRKWKRLVSTGMLEDLGEPVLALARKHEEPGGSMNRNLREAYFDVWRLIVRAIRDDCKDEITYCPTCGDLWLRPAGQKDAIAYRRVSA